MLSTSSKPFSDEEKIKMSNNNNWRKYLCLYQCPRKEYEEFEQAYLTIAKERLDLDAAVSFEETTEEEVYYMSNGLIVFIGSSCGIYELMEESKNGN